jgi:hypothetical protein
MNNILHRLFHGKMPKWDNSSTKKTEELTRQIAIERQYFSTIMSDENFKRFKKLERIHSKRNSIKYMNTYTNAFKTGAMLMCAVFMDEETEIYDKI